MIRESTLNFGINFVRGCNAQGVESITGLVVLSEYMVKWARSFSN